MNGTPQAQAEQPATAAGDPADVKPQSTDLADGSLEDLDNVQTRSTELTPKPESAGGKEVTTEQPKPPVVEEPKPPAEEPKPPAEEPEPEVVKEPEAELPSRFRFKDATDQAIVAVKKAAEAEGNPISWAEAEKRVRGEPAAPTEKGEPKPDPVATAQEDLTRLEAEIVETRALANPPNEDQILSTKAMRDAHDKLLDLLEQRREIKDYLAAAEFESRSQTAAKAQAHRDAKAQSRARAIQTYPDVADENTPLGKAVAKAFEEMRDPESRNHPVLYADDSPEIITEREARRLGIAPKTPQAAAPTPKSATPPAKKAVPPSGAKTSVPDKPAEQLVGQQAMEYLRGSEVSLDELDAVTGADKGLAAAVR